MFNCMIHQYRLIKLQGNEEMCHTLTVKENTIYKNKNKNIKNKIKKIKIIK